MTLTPGQVLNNRYRVVKLLGEGGFGAVYRAWDLNMQAPVALKENFDTASRSQRQFQIEARLLFSLSHPNLPRVFDHFAIPGQGQYLVMDFIDGEDLGSKIVRSGGPLPQSQVLPWLVQICDALEYLHGQNPPVIHRDIKPANIRITPAGKAVLVDFGIAKTFDPLQKTTVGARAVTPGYSPPEQFGQGITDAQSDVYSLGATAYHLLTSQVPPSAMDVISGQAPPPRPAQQLNPSLSPQLSALLEQSMQFNRSQRLGSAAAFKAATVHMQAPPGPAPVVQPPAVSAPFAASAAGPRVMPTQVAPAPSAPLAAPPQTYAAPQEAYAAPQAEGQFVRKLLAGAGAVFVIGGIAILVLAAFLLWRFVFDSPGAITASNASKLGEVAHWGKGTMDEVAWSPDGRLIALASSQGIHLYDAASLSEVRFIETEAWVGSVAFSADGQILASGSADSRVQLWRVSDGSLLRTLEGHSDRVTSVAFALDGLRLASASWDKSVRIWRVSDGAQLHNLQGHTDKAEAVAFSPDSQVLASASSDATIRLWNVNYGTPLDTLTVSGSSVYAVAFSPDGKKLASASTDEKVLLWSVSDGSIYKVLEGHTSTVESLAFSPDGQTLATASWDNTVRLWRAQDGLLLRTLEGHTGAVYSLALSPDGERLASASWDGSVRVWQTADGKTAGTLKELTGGMCHLVFSADNRSVAAALDDGSLLRWEFGSDAQIRLVTVHDEGCSKEAAISPDGKVLAAASSAETIALWRASDGSLLHKLDASSVYKIIFSPDGSLLAAGATGVWRVQDGALLYTLKAAPGTPLAFSPNSAMLATRVGESDIGLWRASDGSLAYTLKGHTVSVSDLAFSPDGETLASTSSSDKTVRLWRASDGALLHTATLENGVSDLLFSPDGKTLAVPSGKNILLLSGSNGSLLRTLEGHSDSILRLAFSLNSDILATASADSTVRLWRVSNGELLNTLAAHRDGVRGLAFSPDGKYLATAAEDGFIRIWGLP